MNGRRRFSQRQFGGNWNNPYPAVMAQNFGMTLAELFNPYSRTNRAGSNASTLNALKLADAASGVRLNRQKALALENEAKKLAEFWAIHPDMKTDPMAQSVASGVPLDKIQHFLQNKEQYKLLQEAQQQDGLTPLQIANMGSNWLTGHDLGNLFALAYNNIPVHPNTGEPLPGTPQEAVDIHLEKEKQLGLQRQATAGVKGAQESKIRELTPVEVKILDAKVLDLGAATNLKKLRGFLVQANTRLSKLQALSKKYALENIDPLKRSELDEKIKKLKGEIEIGKDRATNIKASTELVKAQTKLQADKHRLMEGTIPLKIAGEKLRNKVLSNRIKNIEAATNRTELLTQLTGLDKELRIAQIYTQDLRNEASEEQDPLRKEALEELIKNRQASTANMLERKKIIQQQHGIGNLEIEKRSLDLQKGYVELDTLILKFDELEKKAESGLDPKSKKEFKKIRYQDPETGKVTMRMVTLDPATGKAVFPEGGLEWYEPKFKKRKVIRGDKEFEQMIDVNKLNEKGEPQIVYEAEEGKSLPGLKKFDSEAKAINWLKNQIVDVRRKVSMSRSLVGAAGGIRRLLEYGLSGGGLLNTAQPARNLARQLMVLGLQLQETITSETGKFTENDVARVKAIMGHDDIWTTANSAIKSYGMILEILETKHPSFSQEWIDNYDKNVPNARNSVFRRKDTGAVLYFDKRSGQYKVKY